MKKIFGLMAIALSVSFANASTRTVGIVEIENADGTDTNLAVYATDGEIYEVDAQDELTISDLTEAMDKQQRVTLSVSDYSNSEDVLGVRAQILGIKRISHLTDEALAPKSNRKLLLNNSLLMSDYVTNFTDSSKVQRIFRSQRTDTRKRSQCYNRAHVWSWEMRRFSEGGRVVQPGKMWIYFTKKYIRAYKYKWWFHVAPFVTINNQDTVMDKKFLSGPVSRRQWSDFFIQPRTQCPLITKYSQYKNNPRVGNCFLMRTSVHYFQPYQAKDLERGRGEVQNSWKKWELKRAYKNGVGSRKIPNL